MEAILNDYPLVKTFLSKSLKDKKAIISDLDKILIEIEEPDRIYEFVYRFCKEHNIEIIDSQEESSSHFTDIISQYQKNIKNMQNLSLNKEKLLAKKYQDGDITSRNKLIEANLKLVYFFSLKFLNQGISQEDLIQEGNIGLMKAIDKYEPNKNIKLSTYASWYIRQHMAKYIANQSDNFSLPSYLNQELQQINKLEHKLTQENQKTITNKELLHALEESGLNEKQAQNRILKLASVKNQITVSLNEPVAEEMELEEQIASKEISPEQHFFNNINKTVLNQLLDTLPTKNKQIIIWRFGLDGNNPLSLSECGKKLNLSKERIRQIEKKTLRFLNASNQSKNIKEKFINN